MSIKKPSSSILSPTNIAICIKVLTKFKADYDHGSINENEFYRIRALVHSLRRRINRIKKANSAKKSPAPSGQRSTAFKVRPNRQGQLARSSSHVSENNRDSSQQSTECYLCYQNYHTSHAFYDQLCPSCAEFNYQKRLQTTDLSDHVALVTDGRTDVGYRVVLKLLRSGCFVISTTRYPIDFLHRLQNEMDYAQWKHRIHIYRIDLRYSSSVQSFAQICIEKYHRLDFLINYAHPRPEQVINENLSIDLNDEQLFLSNDTPEIVPTTSIPVLIVQTQDSSTAPMEIDHSLSNRSLSEPLANLSTQDISEILTTHTLTPFILSSQLKPLMTEKHPEPQTNKFIINVVTSTGAFSHSTKTDRHPHLNAASAALNMMTRTSAIDYKSSNIYMVSVDAGLFTTQEAGVRIPFDDEDAAARILDPIIDTYRQYHEGKANVAIPCGCLLKDYQTRPWY